MVGRRLAWLYYKSTYRPTTGDLIGSVFAGQLCGLFWPFILPAIGIYQLFDSKKSSIRSIALSEPRPEREKRRAEELERQVMKQKQEISRLERFLNV